MSQLKEGKELQYFKGDELAASVWRNKYAADGEVNPDDTHLRMAKEFARIEVKYGKLLPNNETKNKLSKYGKERLSKDQSLKAITERIYSYFKDFKYIIPQGSVMSILGTNVVGSLSNCFVIDSPDDSYGGIMEKDEEMAQLMKRRGGVGLDISTLRPAGVIVKNSAKTSTGAASFMERYSNTCREVAQQGRRGALMITMDVRHPDIFEFVTMKQDLSKVTGANVSVQLRDDFMKAVETDSDYVLTFPCTIELNNSFYEDLEDFEYNKLYNGGLFYFKRIKAKELYDKIVECAWNTAEPGQMFKDRGIDYSPDGVYPQYRLKAPNPCGEQLLDPHNSCRLICENIYSFVVNPFTPEASIDFEKLYEISYEQMVLGDNLVDLEIEYVQRIIDKILSEARVSDVELDLWLKVKDKAIKSRRVGCGITGLADMIAAMGYQYDSNEALKLTEKVMYVKMKAELDASIDMAILRGSFVDHDCHAEFDIDHEGMIGANEFYQMLHSEFPEQVEKMCLYGRRNVSWSTIAPTGSVSICTQTTSGCEPLFMPYYQRNKKVQGDEVADFVDAKGDKWKKFFVVHPKLIDFSKAKFDVDCSQFKEEAYLIDLFKQSPYNNSTAESIDWQQRVKMQAVLQKFTTNAISSTINLPADVTKEEVAKIYIESWKQGLKGVTVYRDGCRTGVLVKVEKEQPKERPNTIQGELHIVSNFNIIVGLVNNNPYEVFAFKGIIPNEKNGYIVKENKTYLFRISNGVDIPISEAPTAEERAVARLISAGLRGGADVKFLVEQLMKTEGSLQSINFALAKVLGTYIPDGSTSSLTCSDCGSEEVVFQEGCLSCKSCGSSKCG